MTEEQKPSQPDSSQPAQQPESQSDSPAVSIPISSDPNLRSRTTKGFKPDVIPPKPDPEIKSSKTADENNRDTTKGDE